MRALVASLVSSGPQARLVVSSGSFGSGTYPTLLGVGSGPSIARGALARNLNVGPDGAGVGVPAVGRLNRKLVRACAFS
jgi:hypothetical protein